MTSNNQSSSEPSKKELLQYDLLQNIYLYDQFPVNRAIAFLAWQSSDPIQYLRQLANNPSLEVTESVMNAASFSARQLCSQIRESVDE
jgi:hypothetical protein